MTRLSPLTQATLFIALITLLRITVNFSGQFQLFFDEAQYWTWAKALDFGYFSKPPVIAWLIAATTSVCGDGVGCVKLSAPLLHAGTAILVYLSAARLCNTHTAFWASILYITLPGVTAGSAFISSDAPLMFCWGLALYSFIHVLESDDNRWWLMLGIACGLGMMSKYTMIIFYLSVFIYLLTNKQHRALLLSAKAWGAVIISALIFFPNIWWNITHDFISISHTNENVLDSGRFELHIIDTAEFIGAQLILFGPLLYWVLARHFRTLISITSGNMFILGVFTFTLLAIAIIVSLIASAQAHWAAPAYISGCILASHLALQKKSVWVVKSSIYLSMLVLFLFLNINYLLYITNIKHNPLSRVEMWNKAAEHTHDAMQENANLLLASDERKGVATLMYNLRNNGTPAHVIKWNINNRTDDYYDMATSMNNIKGRTILMLTRTDGKDIAAHFNFAKTYETFTIGKHRFKLLLLGGFKKQ